MMSSACRYLSGRRWGFTGWLAAPPLGLGEAVGRSEPPITATVSYHPAVSSRVLDRGGKDSGRSVAIPVSLHQRSQGGRTQQRRVAGQDDQVPVAVVG